MAARVFDILHDMEWIVGLIAAVVPKPGLHGSYKERNGGNTNSDTSEKFKRCRPDFRESDRKRHAPPWR